MIYLNIERTEEPDILLKFKTLDETLAYVRVELDTNEDFMICNQPMNHEDKEYILIEPVPDSERMK